ncbi:MAG: aspartate--tRNA(Asn) ligase [Spirochaetaceae bacterium]|jgi:nondiscriminating aspartyl-tRNA synthetase|nr:aspartate--tRNA(Asn) ligase [Spirochaetaceae bacterium]
MERILAKDIKQAAQSAGKDVFVSGWVHRIRELGGVSFVVLRDRSGLVQLVLDKKCDLTLESVITAQGEAALNEKAPGGAELRVTQLECLSKAASDLPFQVNGDVSKMGLESILDHRTLSVRNPKIRAIFKIQSTIIEAFAQYLRDNDFTEIKSSKLCASGTEGGTNLFQVEYFDRKVYLAQSPQFYKQAMVASGLERVFEIAPAYRAEKHDTPRHLNEYVSLDLEMGFIESEKELIELEKGVLAYIFSQVAEKNSAELEMWASGGVPDPDSVQKSPTIPYEEALKIASTESAKKNGARVFDITPEAERFLCEWSAREYGSELVFVNEFPRKHRPFYTYPLDATRTMAFDALFRGLEITSGGRRQHDYAAQLEALPRFGLNPKDMEGYLAIFKYGCPPHGGLAIGCERLTARILGLPNVKEASLFPRDRKRVEP